MWRELVGTWVQAAGSSGTVTLPKGGILLQIVAVDTGGGGSVAIFGGTAIPLTAAVPLSLRFNHTLAQAPTADQTVVFTGTDSYFVEYLKAPGT